MSTRRRGGYGLGLAMLIGGCGMPGASGPLAASPEAPGTGVAVPLTRETRLSPERTLRVPVSFQSPRTSFSSDKIDLIAGKTLPLDDGMGPEGDISFFYDGSRFQVIANAGGGANRALARAESGRAKEDLAMAPIPLQEGSEVLVKHDHGAVLLRITELSTGSMRFLPSGTGTGSGSVAFDYRIAAN